MSVDNTPAGNASDERPAVSRSPIVGIDLGTTRSVIAWVDSSGKPVTIFSSEGEPTTPSVVLFESDGVTVGKEALKALQVLPNQVATFAKREMGNVAYSREINGTNYPPELIQSLVLGKLRRDAQARLGMPVTQAVITVPAYFNEPKRRSTMDAGRLAGLDVRAVINEPTAAAIAYGVDKQSQATGPMTILVYDLGGGTFDSSLVRINGRKFDVIATDGNAMLGGMDWDKCLARWIDQEFAIAHGFHPSSLPGGDALLLREAEELKHTLTSRRSADVRVVFDGRSLQTKMTRDDFEELTAHLLDRTRFTIAKLVEDSGISWIEVDRILMVGGSTRMPQIHQMLAKETGIEPESTISADEAVAHGAALFAMTLLSPPQPASAPAKPSAQGTAQPVSPDVNIRPTSNRPFGVVGSQGSRSNLSSGVQVTDVNAHHLGVIGVDKKTGQRVNHIMIRRNTPLPAARVSRFETNTDNQPNVVVEVVEGGDAMGAHATAIGRCVVDGLPPHLAAGTPVDVAFRYDADGIIHVEASLPRSGQKASLTINRAADPTEEERDAMQDILAELGLDD
ncbi:Chaperone protein DnaK [Rubripirellula lacrimiformis]|uniref:Chaperone protein DnaK n=1 Tax=Rubripirellula lacrimiformis TaxID=1930273 RepID=A0A517NKQ6_9BACT|nr:Hsp70 family protein [Rubripirellula lacrimiformis]QDT07728.1 Chaperone protein DnaK [Rubripirellula lacrimiformis]